MRLFLSVLLTFCASSLQAGDALFSKHYPGWAQWDKKCHRLSLKYKKKFPTQTIKPICSVAPKPNKEGVDFNQVNARHLYGLLAELFYSKKNSERRAALTLLYSYTCDTQALCTEFKKILEREISKDYLKLSLKDPPFFNNIKDLKDRVKLNPILF
jgi:hypothetical protein